jgi:hypothetical protein
MSMRRIQNSVVQFSLGKASGKIDGCNRKNTSMLNSLLGTAVANFLTKAEVQKPSYSLEWLGFCFLSATNDQLKTLLLDYSRVNAP